MLHVFGDSFSIPDSHRNEVFGPKGTPITYLPLEKNWTTIVNESIYGNSEYENHAVLGCSNDYIYYKLFEKEPFFKDGDCIIIQLTSMYREWFFENKPYLATNLGISLTPDVEVTKKEYEALEMYKRHLYFEKRPLIRFNMFLDSLSLRTQLYGKKNIKCLILPGFHNIKGVEGSLCEASGLEFDCEKTAIAYYNKTGDYRFNHFSEVNHKILANKIINFFDTFEKVDLTTGFETNIYSRNDI